MIKGGCLCGAVRYEARGEPYTSRIAIARIAEGAAALRS